MIKKVFIWGSYEYGNYGDDIMALYFGCLLKSMGYDVCVYRLNSFLGEKYELSVTDCLASGLKDADACVLGGGALFNAYSVNNECYDAYKKDILELSSLMREGKVPTIGLSLGTGGLADASQLSAEQLDLLENPYFLKTTVRSRSDLDLFKGRVSAVYVDDIVLALARGLNLTCTSSARRLLVNLPRLPLVDPLFCFMWKLYSKVHRVEVINHSTYSDGSPVRQTEHGYGHGLVGFQDPIEVLRAYGNEETTILSYKLHFGMSFLSFGSRFLSFRGKMKTQNFLREHALSGNIIGFSDLFIGYFIGFHNLSKVSRAQVNDASSVDTLDSYKAFLSDFFSGSFNES
jgi:hypothetical protein